MSSSENSFYNSMKRLVLKNLPVDFTFDYYLRDYFLEER